MSFSIWNKLNSSSYNLLKTIFFLRIFFSQPSTSATITLMASLLFFFFIFLPSTQNQVNVLTMTTKNAERKNSRIQKLRWSGKGRQVCLKGRNRWEKKLELNRFVIFTSIFLMPLLPLILYSIISVSYDEKHINDAKKKSRRKWESILDLEGKLN